MSIFWSRPPVDGESAWRRSAALVVALFACTGLFWVAGATGTASAQWGYYCPYTSNPDETISLDPGTEGTCVHTIYRYFTTQISVYRRNNTSVRHCGGGHSTTSRWSEHKIPYACGIGSGQNGFLATPYDSSGTSAYPIHKNSDCCRYGGFNGWWNSN